MTRLLPLAALAVLLAACEHPADGLTVDETVAAADSATVAGDGWLAMRLYRHAADRGSYTALRVAANAYRTGAITRRQEPGEDAHAPVPIVTFPGQAKRWSARYLRDRDRLARDGDLDALLGLAQDLTHPAMRRQPGGTADPDSISAVYRQLVEAGHEPALIMLALREREAGNHAASDSLLARAEQSETPALRANACRFRVYYGDEGVRQVTATQTARFIDRMERCHALNPVDLGHSGDLIATLRRGEANGTAASAALLDSLRHLGVFERHPRLADVPAETRG